MGTRLHGGHLKTMFIWRRVTWLAELLGKGEIPAAILKYCFAGSLFIWDRRVTRLAEISAKRAGISARGVDNCPM